MRDFIKSWKFPVVLFAPVAIYAIALLLFKKDLQLQDFIRNVILTSALPTLILLAARFETPRQTRERAQRVEQREAEELAAMTPEQQQLHLNAKNKIAEFQYSLAVFVVTCIFSGAIIYYFNWVL